MQITKEWLEGHNACNDGKEWFLAERIFEPISALENMIKKEKIKWANWLIVRVMERKQYIAYTIYAAEQVIHIYEKKYPEDKRPRIKIKAAKCINNNTVKNRHAAAYADAAAAYAAVHAAADAAAADAAAAYAAVHAADDAVHAADDAAADAAAYTAYTAYAVANDAYLDAVAPDIADATTYAIAYAAYAAARRGMELKILNYGLKLLKGEV